MSDLNVYSTTAAVNALTPVDGDMVVDTEANAVKVYCNSAWKVFNSDAVGFTNRWGADFTSSEKDTLEIASSIHSTFQSAYSISTWFKNSSSIGAEALFGSDSRGPNNAVIVYRSASSLSGYISVNGSDANLNISLSTDTAWHHFCLTVLQNGTTVEVRAFVDGVYKQLSTISGKNLSDYANSLPLLVGGRRFANPASNDLFFNGSQDDFAIFPSALSYGGVSVGQSATGEVASLRDTSGSSPVPADISGLSPAVWYRMGDDTSDSASDGANITGLTNTANPGTLDATTAASAQPTFSDLTGETIYA